MYKITCYIYIYVDILGILLYHTDIHVLYMLFKSYIIIPLVHAQKGYSTHFSVRLTSGN